MHDDKLHRLFDYVDGTNYMHRYQGGSSTCIYNHKKAIIRYDDGRYPWRDYIIVARLPKNYWYSGITHDDYELSS